MEVYSLKIRRYNPDDKDTFQQEDFEVEAGEGEKITYGLSEAYKKHDPSLSYMVGCKTGHCGLCSMVINGKPGLACVENIGPNTELEPLKGLPVVKDLVIDREAVFQNIGNRIRKIASLCGFRPFELAGKGDLSPKDFLEKTNCILCLSCLSVCPAREKGDSACYLPLEFIFLDMMNLKGMEDRERGRNVLDEMGMTECIDCRKCQSACPRDIEIFEKIIEPIKLYFSL